MIKLPKLFYDITKFKVTVYAILVTATNMFVFLAAWLLFTFLYAISNIVFDLSIDYTIYSLCFSAYLILIISLRYYLSKKHKWVIPIFPDKIDPGQFITGPAYYYDITEYALREGIASRIPTFAGNGSHIGFYVDKKKLDEILERVREAAGHRYISYSEEKISIGDSVSGRRSNKSTGTVVVRLNFNYLFKTDLVILKMLVG